MKVETPKKTKVAPESAFVTVCIDLSKTHPPSWGVIFQGHGTFGEIH